ncbi:MAG TPA: tryptophan synthase subunit alpha [Gemmatimonadaceae bacterium]|jgi:tryptophan synthase alpha chain|nr:tryptophan synthase subunit alpha [Gemmatimonadaceae bacterium]
MASGLATISSDVIARRFAELRARNRRALVPYITAGYPDEARTIELMRGLEDAGADVIELGLPFSDPMADGPVIQASSQRALELGMNFDRLLDLVGQANVRIPLVLFSYLNPILAAGDDALVRAAQAGMSGLLLTDLPVGADPEREARIGEGPLEFIRLVAPTTPLERMREIGEHGRGFVYLISRLGVTGARDDLPAELPATARRLREATSLPVCVGFGVSRPEQAARVAGIADGVVVGSAIVRAAGETVSQAVALAASLRAAIDAA